MRRVFDIACPINSAMWAYRDEWRNEIATIASTHQGDKSTAYRFNLCSHTGTYIETSQHKLRTDVLLDDFPVESFVRPCIVVRVDDKQPGTCVSRNEVESQLERFGVGKDDAVIVVTGWGRHHQDVNYIPSCPYFARELTDYLADLDLGLLGVDVPVIDHQADPYDAIAKLFKATPQLLVLAPLVVDSTEVYTGKYTLSTSPLNIEGVCASLCRPVLIEE